MINCADGSFGTIVANRSFGTIVTNGSFHFTIMGAIVSDHELEDLVIHWRQWRQPPLDYFAVQLQWCHKSNRCQCTDDSFGYHLATQFGYHLATQWRQCKWRHWIAKWSTQSGWRFRNEYHHRMAQVAPFKLIYLIQRRSALDQWMPMPPSAPMVIVIAIGATDQIVIWSFGDPFDPLKLSIVAKGTKWSIHQFIWHLCQFLDRP